MEEQKTYGTVTVGAGTLDAKELKIVDFIQTDFKDHRVVSVSKLEDDSFVLAVENPTSTGRNAQSTIWLSKESLIGMLSTTLIYFQMAGENLDALLKEAVESKDIEYRYSDNLKPFEYPENKEQTNEEK